MTLIFCFNLRTADEAGESFPHSHEIFRYDFWMRLLHLSDIHFEEPDCLNPDMDQELPNRTLLSADLVDLCNGQPVDAILVGGDIAFKAHPDEFKTAETWLVNLAAKCGCPPERIFVVPGNHDVDRSICKKSKAVSNAQAEIARADWRLKEETLRGQLRDEDAGPALFRPLTAYNAFAAKFGCNVYASQPYWKYDLSLGGGVTLRLYGLTSTLISGLGDRDDAPGKLYLSPLQTVLNPEPDVFNLVMAHHPPNWFSDANEVDDAVNDRAPIQLFGHEHRQRCTATQDYVRFSAGALHPERNGTEWKPGYNLIDLTVHGEGGSRFVRMQAHVRQLQKSPEQFIPLRTKQGHEVWWSDIQFPVRATRVVRHGPSPAEIAATPAAPVPAASPAEVAMSSPSTKNLVFRFGSLTGSQKRELTLRLKLITDADMKMDEPERYTKALRLAAQRGQLEELAGEIEKLEQKG